MTVTASESEVFSQWDDINDINVQLPLLAYQVNYNEPPCNNRSFGMMPRGGTLTRDHYQEEADIQISWIFGFANLDAMSQGLSGADCRGGEHEVILLWNKSSFECTILFDNVQVHRSTRTDRDDASNYIHTSFDVPASSTSLSTSSNSRENHHIIQIKADFSRPSLLERTRKRCRKFDMIVDGLSYFDMCKIYRLGMEYALQQHSFGEEEDKEVEEIDTKALELSECSKYNNDTFENPHKFGEGEENEATNIFYTNDEYREHLRDGDEDGSGAIRRIQPHDTKSFTYEQGNARTTNISERDWAMSANDETRMVEIAKKISLQDKCVIININNEDEENIPLFAVYFVVCFAFLAVYFSSLFYFLLQTLIMFSFIVLVHSEVSNQLWESQYS